MQAASFEFGSGAVPAVTRDALIEACVQRLITRRDFPAFSAHICDVMRTADDEDSSASHITKVILRDVGLTAKVLRTVNSLYYNRSGREIRGVVHAVAMLGANAIRDLAGSMILVDHFRKKTPGVCELMMLSLITANHARLAAELADYPRLEEAYLCGMFRNLGELLIACYEGEAYRQILTLASESLRSEKQSAIDVLGFSYDDLGKAMICYWGMPDPVRHCMDEMPAGLSKSETSILLAATNFGHEMTTALYRCEPKQGRAIINRLVDGHGALLRLKERDVDDIAHATLDEARCTMSMLHVVIDDLKLKKQTEMVLGTGEQPGRAEAEQVDLKRLERLATRVRDLVTAEEAADVNEALTAVLDSIRTGCGFPRAIFGLVEPDGNLVRGRLGSGQNAEEGIEKFEFNLLLRSGPVARAMLLRQDVFVSNDRDGRYEQSQLVRLMESGCFGLYPVIVQKKLVGCLYFDDPSPRGELSPQCLELLAELRECAVVAIERSRHENAAAGKPSELSLRRPG